MENPVIILGAGNLGKVAFDLFTSNGVLVYCFLDEDESKFGTEIEGISVLGDLFDDGHLKMIGKKCNAFVAVDNLSLRKSVIENLLKRRKEMPINAVHNAAILSERAMLGHGNYIAHGVCVGTNTDIKSHCLIHSGAIIEDHVKINDFVQIGAGSIISSTVEIGEGAFIGSGATIVSGIKIGKGARVGAGSVVIKDVQNNQTVFGNPATAVD